MKKRGVSPLIATVLLIGFAVIIAVSVWLWYSNIVQGEFMKQGALSQIQTDCLSDIELQIISASAADGNIDIKNSGNKLFNGIRVLINDGESVSSIQETFNPGDQKTINIPAISEADRVSVMPMIVRQGVPGTCSEKKVTSKLSSI